MIHDPARIVRQATAARFARVDDVDDGLVLVWEHDDVPVARGVLVKCRRRGRPGRSVMAGLWSRLRTGQRQETLWILASAPRCQPCCDG